MNSAPIGVVGVGRLGRVLAQKLSTDHRILACDIRKEALQATAAGRTGQIDVAAFEDIAARAALVFFCTQGPETVALLRRASALRLTKPLYVSLVTRLSEHELQNDPEISGLDITSVKVVGQFKAIEAGLPALFIASSADRARSVNVLTCMGEVIVGPQERVSVINRLATRTALEMSERFLQALARLDVPETMALAALKNVLIGTILDHPAEPDNEYINSLLREMVAERDKAPPRSAMNGA